MEESRYIKIGFTFTDHYGNEYSANSKVEVMDEYEDDLDVIGRAFNTFLGQVGYSRKGTCVLTESLSEKEHDMLCDYLDAKRSAK